MCMAWSSWDDYALLGFVFVEEELPIEVPNPNYKAESRKHLGRSVSFFSSWGAVTGEYLGFEATAW